VEARLKKAGFIEPSFYVLEHGYCRSIYATDPNGMILELTVDNLEAAAGSEQRRIAAHNELKRWLAGELKQHLPCSDAPAHVTVIGKKSARPATIALSRTWVCDLIRLSSRRLRRITGTIRFTPLGSSTLCDWSGGISHNGGVPAIQNPAAFQELMALTATVPKLRVRANG
jgi:hypothetical protein